MTSRWAGLRSQNPGPLGHSGRVASQSRKVSGKVLSEIYAGGSRDPEVRVGDGDVG